MKPLIFLLLASFLSICSNSYGQKQKSTTIYDHITIYDTITVYDTIVIYDTVVEENITNKNLEGEIFSQKTENLQNTVLAIDTTTHQAQLFIFNEKDTATILINRILFNENHKNDSVMKKGLLGLLAVSFFSATISGTNDSLFTSHVNLNIGAITGICHLYNDNITGGYLRINKAMNKKWLIGLSSDIANISPNDNNHRFGILDNTVKVGQTKGVYNDLLFSCTYYLKGNTQNSKSSVYLRHDIGNYLYYSHQYLQFDENSQIISSTLISRANGFITQIALGANCNLKKGMIHGEFFYSPFAYGFAYINYDKAGPGIEYNIYPNGKLYRFEPSAVLGARLGYTFRLK